MDGDRRLSFCPSSLLTESVRRLKESVDGTSRPMIYRTTVGAADILRAGARCRRPPVGIPRVGAQTGWPEVVGKKVAEGREKGGRREEEGRQEQGRGREEEGGREERGTFLWSLGSRGVPWELSSGAWVLLGGPRGFQGCSLGTPGGCLGVLGLSPGGLGMSFGVRWCPWSQNGRF